MRRQTYLLRKGARYHFRRRFPPGLAGDCPITVALGTADPERAKCLTRRLAARWDDLVVKVGHIFKRGTLTIEEQRTLFRQALVDELTHATRGGLSAVADLTDDKRHRKILIAAYSVAANLEHDAEILCRDDIEAVMDSSWSAADRALLIKTITLYVTPMTINRGDAKALLEELKAPVNAGTLSEARKISLDGRIEAQRRASLLGHPLFSDRDVPAHFLLDDDLVQQARRIVPIEASHASTMRPGNQILAVPVSAPVVGQRSISDERSHELFAASTPIRFSEQIESVLAQTMLKNRYKPDNGQRLRMLETFAWITGDKTMSDYEPSDIQAYVTAMANIPKDFRFGKLHKFGAMATPYADAIIPACTAETKRSDRTINRDLSFFGKVSTTLSKGHWRSRYNNGLVMDFLSEWIKIEVDDQNPSRVPWTPDHLRAMYSLPLWQGGGGPLARLKPNHRSAVYQDAAYWLPLFGTYMGVAREEGAGFEIVDFNFDCSVPYVLVQANMTRSKDGINKAGLKRQSRNRVMPLHPELLRLGLEDYVAAMAAEGHDMIFPELYSDEAVAGSERGRKAPSIGGRRFYAIAWCFLVDATHSVMPLPETASGKKADFHSQRTYNNSVLASPEVSQSILDKHMGHAQKGTGRRNYDRRSLALGEVVELRERLDIMVKQMPNVTAHIRVKNALRLLPLKDRSRVGSAPGRNAKHKFCV